MLCPTGSINNWCRGVMIVVTLTAFFGCSPRSADEIVAERERVVGTWEYKTDGIRSLQRGSLRITVQDGELVGRLQDSWRGTVHARIRLQGNRMSLDLDRLRIAGTLEDGYFRGSVRSSAWDMSRSTDRPSQSTGYFVARRVRSTSVLNNLRDLGCASLLRESSYRCSALPQQ